MEEKRIIFCLPGSNFSNKFLESWTNLIIYCMRKGIQFAVSQATDSVVYYVRSKCLGGDVLRGEKQLPFNGKVPYTHTMWIDSDMVFAPEQFQKLLDHDLDIVAGAYKTADNKTFPIVKRWDEEYFKKHGTFQFMNEFDIKKSNKLMEVVYTGFGFMMIKYGVFEAVGYPWFRPVFHTIGQAKDFSSEDVSFCWIAREKGFKIFVDPTIRLGHEKKVTFV